MAGRPGGVATALPGTILLAVHDFVARSQDELSLAKGDRIELIERDDDFGDGWFLGKHLAHGASGLFPEVYTTPAPKGTLSSALGKTRAVPNNASHNNVPANGAPSEGAIRAAQNAAAALASPLSGTVAQPQTTKAMQTQSLPPASTLPHPPLVSAALRTSLPSPASVTPAAGRSFTLNADSPVMNETLSVIDEHITDMKQPRSASDYTNGSNLHMRDAVSSVYSSTPSIGRQSYIAGHETDEEEQQAHTEEEVSAWTPARVAEHLEDAGVEPAHCAVFMEQDISGEVLLAMDQNSLFLKEFDLGSVGRRLKTWHKIKALQDEMRTAAQPERARSVSEYSMTAEDDRSPAVDAARNRSSTLGSASLPRGLSTRRGSGEVTPVREWSAQSTTPAVPQRESWGGVSPLQSMTSSSRPESSVRPSAQSIRNLNHTRRHSSIDSTPYDATTTVPRTGHRKQPSIDRKWQPGQANARHGHTTSDSHFSIRNSLLLTTPTTSADLDRGYFSEAEHKSRRNVLTKRHSATASPGPSRDGSVILEHQTSPISAAADVRDSKRHSASLPHQPAAPHTGIAKFSGHRSATVPLVPGGTKASKQIAAASSPSSSSPTVTKLDYGSTHSLGASAGSPTKTENSEASSQKTTSSPASTGLSFLSSARAKVTSLRSTSDAVTKSEKTSSPTTAGARSRTTTGSSTPSTENRSLELAKPDSHSRASTGSGQNLMPPAPTTTRRPRAKSKKFTSAYQRGLEKKSPQEQMLACDYSGWMWKKSSTSLVATWKTRLFVLKGRRLSYYYRDDDEDEKGLIDISFHRVLPAQNETLTGVLATVTGVGGSPTSPAPHATPTIAQQDLRNFPPPTGDNDEGLFIFKLVPPRAGLSKGVSFTKPTVHYFAVKSRQEGRLWMAALMKATIDRDDTGLVTTTYNQKTISLAKARARRERPPALQEDGTDGRAELEAAVEQTGEHGLGIGGLDQKEHNVDSADSDRTATTDAVDSAVSSTHVDGEDRISSEKYTDAAATHAAS